GDCAYDGVWSEDFEANGGGGGYSDVIYPFPGPGGSTANGPGGDAQDLVLTVWANDWNSGDILRQVKVSGGRGGSGGVGGAGGAFISSIGTDFTTGPTVVPG
ncbi:hypothetical protein, partial [Polaribacter sargassicola]|uniref:hypothetical protein n=1 Tax=Polaribacter sargassicola TaxID=2836891 RepID=UPI001F3CC0D6